MSNNRPYRATYVGATRTVHYDYETKEARKLLEGPRDQAGQGGIPVTVTSRKPLKPGTPVCWVNVYAANSEPEHLHAHASKSAADAMASPGRLHCIPVYLPGEGAEPVTEQMREAAVSYYMQGVKDRQRIGELEAEVERLKTALTETMAQRDEAQRLHSKAEGEVECRNQMRAEHRAEVERLTTLAKDWETTARVRAEERDTARAEVARLTAELAEARVTWGSAEIASLRKLYAAAMEVRSWFDPPKHVQNALIRAVHDHAEKFGKPTEQP